MSWTKYLEKKWNCIFECVIWYNKDYYFFFIKTKTGEKGNGANQDELNKPQSRVWNSESSREAVVPGTTWARGVRGGSEEQSRWGPSGLRRELWSSPYRTDLRRHRYSVHTSRPEGRVIQFGNNKELSPLEGHWGEEDQSPRLVRWGYHLSVILASEL